MKNYVREMVASGHSAVVDSFKVISYEVSAGSESYLGYNLANISFFNTEGLLMNRRLFRKFHKKKYSGVKSWWPADVTVNWNNVVWLLPDANRQMLAAKCVILRRLAQTTFLPNEYPQFPAKHNYHVPIVLTIHSPTSFSKNVRPSYASWPQFARHSNVLGMQWGFVRISLTGMWQCCLLTYSDIYL